MATCMAAFVRRKPNGMHKNSDRMYYYTQDVYVVFHEMCIGI